MQKLLIKGKKEISGSISISGSKNATLPILAASILAQKDVVGDVIWMMRGERGRVSANDIITSDTSAAKRLSELKPGDWIPTKDQPVPTLAKSESVKDSHGDTSKKTSGEIVSNDTMDIAEENSLSKSGTKNELINRLISSNIEIE